MRRLLAIFAVLLLPVPLFAQSVILGEYRPGRAAAAASLSMTLSTEDKAVLDSLDTKLTTLAGYLDNVEGILTTMDADTGSILLAVDTLETLIGTTNTNTGNSATALQIIDDWDESDRAKVNIIAGQVGVQGGAGALTALVLRVTEATDSQLALDITDMRGSLTSMVNLLTNIDNEMNADASAYDPASPSGPQGMLEFNSAKGAALTGEAVQAQGSSKGEAYVVLRDAAGGGVGANVNASFELLVRDSSVLVDDAAYTVATSRVSAAGLLADETGTDSVDEGDIGIARMTLDRKAISADYAHADAGADSLKYTSAGATEDEHAVKATAGTLYSITVTNTNVAARYLRCENDTAANTTPGSETPELDLAIPGQTAGAGFTTTFPKGYRFSTALTCWTVTGAADTDVAEVAANEIKIFYTFK